MEFYWPWAFAMLVLLPASAYLMMRKDRIAGIRFSSFVDIKNSPVSVRAKMSWLPIALRMVCLLCLITAFARPRKGTTLTEVSTEGVAMEIVVDRSSSMAEEMSYFGRKMSRLEVVKDVLEKFINGDGDKFAGRAGDMIGLISFARYADTQCPLILGHEVLDEFLKAAEIVTQRSEDGTAIGDGLVLAAARLEKCEEEILRRKSSKNLAGGIGAGSDDFKIKSKVVILLTDGINNAGDYLPMEAAKLAKGWGVKVYTIGIGSDSRGRRVMGFTMPGSNNLDEKLLKQIAEETGGLYGRADDAKSLQSLVEKIDQLEKTQVKAIKFVRYDEKFALWAFGGLIALVCEIFLRSSVFRKIP
ncbi:MAG: VWA domain-containing protein [Anaerohalosphaeraceae bacterium]|nr:VWA domain-containing protein [Anaerohalosphaeraceae bacterium]